MGEKFLTDDVAVRRRTCEAYRCQGQTAVGADDAIQHWAAGFGIWCMIRGVCFAEL